MNFTVKFLIAVSTLLLSVFFSVQIQKIFLFILRKLAEKIGRGVQKSEISTQRYMFTHSNSIITRIYNWLNKQIIALGLKSYGVTALGFLVFWSIVAIPLTLVIAFIMSSRIVLSIMLYIIVLLILLFITAIKTASSVIDREDKAMTSMDMIIPDIHNGVHNAIKKYEEILPIELRQDFKDFLQRIKSSMSFRESMIILSDNIGCDVFRDFAQKAIFFEENGEHEAIEMFADIIETNRLRRDLRYSAKLAFDTLKSELLICSAIVWGYGILIGFQENFTRNFFFNTTFGQFLFIVDIVIEIIALGFIVSLRARDI